MRHQIIRLGGIIALIIISFVVLSAPPPPLTLVRFPYLQNLTTSNVTIAWKTNLEGDSVVEYGISPNINRREINPQLSFLHYVNLKGLKENTIYKYRIKTNGIVLMDNLHFKTAPLYSNLYTFAVIGDFGWGSNEEFAIANIIKSKNPDFLITTGDNVYLYGEDSNYDPKLFFPYRFYLIEHPIFPSIGNHDTYTDNGFPYLANFFLPENGAEQKERYYYFEYGSSLFIALDTFTSSYSPNSPQMRWIENLLSKSTHVWKFVYFHDPMYSSGPHGSNINLRNSLQPILEKYNVDIVFQGHDHIYERTYPISSTIRQKGIVYIVSGGGGAPLYDINPHPWTAYYKKTYHACFIQINERKLLLEAIDLNNQIFDSYDIVK